MPAMKPACRFAHSRNSGGSNHTRRPPERRYDSAIQSVQQTSAKVNTCGRVPSTGSAARAPEGQSDASTTGPAPRRRPRSTVATMRAPGDEAHQHGDQEQASDRREGGEDRLGQPFVRNQRIAERRVGEQLAGRDLVVGDDPVAEPDVPPDIRVAQRVETDGAAQEQGRRQQRAARIRKPGEQASRRPGAAGRGWRWRGADEGCHASAA